MEILTIESQVTKVVGNATIGDNTYKVNYEYNSGKTLTTLSAAVWDKSMTKMSGSITLIGENKSVNLPNDDTFNTHVANVDSIIAEVKASLV